MIDYSTLKICSMEYWSVSNSFQWNIQLLAKYFTKIYSSFGGNNIDKFIDNQILPDKLNLFITNLTVIFYD